MERSDDARIAASFGDETTREARALLDGDRVVLVKPPPWPIVARVRSGPGAVVTVTRNAADGFAATCSCEAPGCAHGAAAALAALAHARDQARGRADAARHAAVAGWLARLAEPAAGAITDAVVYVLERRSDGLGLSVVRTADGARRAEQRAELPLEALDLGVLRELAEAGRLRWLRARGAALAWGAPRRAALSWTADPDDPDGGRLGLEDGTLVIAAAACAYLTPDAGLIGPLDLGLPAAVVRRVLTGPAVPYTMRATVEHSLAALAGSEAPPPRPALTARLGPHPKAGRAVVLEAEARYGDERYPLAVWDPARPGCRDLVAEGRLRARLDALTAALPHGEAARGSLAVLADARHVATTLVPTLRGEGWACHLADDFPAEDASVEPSWTERMRPIEARPGWYAVELGVEVAGRTVSLLPLLLRAIRAGALGGDGELVLAGGLEVTLPDGERVHVPAARLERWLAPLLELGLGGLDGDALLLPPAAALAVAEAVPELATRARLAAARTALEGLLELSPRPEPAGFVGELRPYQQLGQAWLRALHDGGQGGLLADDMGLGKTTQLLGFLAGLRADGALGVHSPALVVAPRGVVGNWCAEAARFTPGLLVARHLGPGRARGPAGLRGPDVIVTSYQTLVRDRALLVEVAWCTVVFDEAQQVKNPVTDARRAAAALSARSRFCVTGTPVENHLGELWSQVDLAVPGLLGRRRSFDAIFRRPIERQGATAPLAHLRRRLRPFLLRRRKEEVARELPPRTEVVERIELGPAQRDLYESLRLKLDRRVQGELQRAGAGGASMAILEALLTLRQCCCDPRLIKAPPGAAARTEVGSAKLDRLLDMLEELTAAGRATLVFSQFTSMLALIEQACAERHLATLTLTGATRDRDDVVRRFQGGEGAVFLIGLKAGGVGINLTRADTVIHYDPWWNPAAEAQAADRAHRIGQTQPLTIYRLVARGTLEEAIARLQDDKRRLGEAALAGGGVERLSRADLAELYARVV